VTHHATVRGDTFYEQEEYQLLALFAPFKEWMDTNLGFNVEDALDFLQHVIEHYTTKLDVLIDLHNQSTNISSSTVPVSPEKKQNVPDLRSNIPQIKGTLTFKVSEVPGIDPKYSGRFKSFLTYFSSVFGQTFNDSFKFPSDTNIFRSKPIFRFEEDFIIPSPSTLIWSMQLVLENDMKNDPKQWDRYQKHKGRYLESEATKEFRKIFPKATLHQSLFYNLEENGELKQFELDCLVIYDTNLVLVESKSGVFSDSARKGGVKRLERIIKDNIETAFEQAIRARDYIINTELPIFYDDKGNELLRIEKANYYRFFLVNLTLHNFGEVATMLHKFRKAELYRYDEYPLSLNLNDLKTMADSIAYPSQFLHYIHRRVKLNNRLSDKSSIITTDELDLFAQYFETNLYYDNETDYDFIYIPDYAPEFNQRHLLRMMDMPVPPLEQKLNPQFKKIILNLEDLGKFGFSNIIINLLDFNGETREQLMNYLEKISKKTQIDGDIHDASIIRFSNPTDPKSGIGVTLFTGVLKNRSEMAKKLAAYCELKKNQQKCYEWIGIGHYIDSPRWFVDEAIYMRFEEEYDEELSKIAAEVLKGRNLIKIGRNEQCPCASGKKYKKCHGTR
jgi:hypothetical protein